MGLLNEVDGRQRGAKAGGCGGRQCGLKLADSYGGGQVVAEGFYRVGVAQHGFRRVLKFGFGGFDKSHKIGAILDSKLSEADPDYAKSADIKWNFTKFLIDREGNVVARFEPTASLQSIEESIKGLL